MPYRLIKQKILLKTKDLEDHLNRLAEKYKSFRVIAMTDYMILVWFDDKDIVLYETDRSQVD